MEESVVEVLSEKYRCWFDAIVETGTGSLSSMLADEWTYTNYDGVVRTKAEYLEWVDDFAETPTFEGPYDLVVQRYADLAIVFGGYRVLHERGDGDIVLRFTGVWQWQVDRWRCLLHHNSEVSR